jgi:hypothetical protein
LTGLGAEPNRLAIKTSFLRRSGNFAALSAALSLKPHLWRVEIDTKERLAYGSAQG